MLLLLGDARRCALPHKEKVMSQENKKGEQERSGKQASLDQNTTTRRRGIEPEEQHRQGGHRVPDQGGKKPGAAKRKS